MRIVSPLRSSTLVHWLRMHLPSDLAPDELGGAETVKEIIKVAFGEYAHKENRLSTHELYMMLRESPKFKEAFIPIPGLIVIADRLWNSTEPCQLIALTGGHIGVAAGTAASNDLRPKRVHVGQPHQAK